MTTRNGTFSCPNGDFNQRYERYAKDAKPKDTFELNSPLARRGFNFKGQGKAKFEVTRNGVSLNGTYGVKVGDDKFTYEHDKKKLPIRLQMTDPLKIS